MTQTSTQAAQAENDTQLDLIAEVREAAEFVEAEHG